MSLLKKNYIGELYILDKLKNNTVLLSLFCNNELVLEELYSKYCRKEYLYYLLNTCESNYSIVYNKLENIIKYRCKYNLFLNGKCELCSNNTKPVHSISYNGIDYAKFHIIYIEPAKASDFTVSAVCQHLLMCFDEVINIIIDLIVNKDIKQEKIKMIFNMKNNTNSIRNIQIAKAMYNLINDCYIDEIEEIQVFNFGVFMKFFTRLFTKTFNNKIVCY
jgi:hypothetical protein